MSLIKKLEEKIKKAIISLGYEIDDVKLETCTIPSLGDFQLNVAMGIAKKYHINPSDVATKIIEKLDDCFVNPNIAGAGFINLSINEKTIIEYFNQAKEDFSCFVDLENPKKIVIDYGGANAAKTLHVGHMRSANIGEALKRLAKLFKNEVIGDVHYGDLGRQSGMLISQLMIEQPNLPYFDSNFKGPYPKLNLTAKDLGRMYPFASIAAKEDEKRMKKVREITALIDQGNEAYMELWKKIVDISTPEIKKIYKELNCNFDLWEGELSSLKYIEDTLKILRPYMYESEGALVIDVVKEEDKINIPPLIVIKKDGSTIYSTRDLATIYARIKNINPDEIWYVVDDRQAMYFEQVFRASYLTSLVPSQTKLLHFGFGTINGTDGKPYKTRDGGVMELSMLLEMVYKEINSKIKSEIKGKERKKIAQKLTIATIKYTDLLPYRKTDYIFDPVKFSSLEGKTGPYVLYTLVRIKSLLNKVESKDYQIKAINNDDIKSILNKLIQLPKVLSRSYHETTLNYLTEYLYDISSLFNRFYTANNIINESNDELKETYLAIIGLLKNVISNILNILAIDEVEKM